MTYGWILGEVARRVDGRPFPQLMEEEVCRPLGLENLFVGLPAAAEPRVARLEQPDYRPPPPGDPRTESVPTWMGPLFAMMNRSDARRACIPASNGIMSADAIARHYAALLDGGVDGVQLLPNHRIRLATEPQMPEWRDPPDHPKAWGLGYALGGPGALFSLNPSAFGHVGYGASYGFADPDLGLAVGLTKSRFCGEALALQVADEIRRLIPLA
jgi:CubicO group peptidase (beta-lactamase class C family)